MTARGVDHRDAETWVPPGYEPVPGPSAVTAEQRRHASSRLADDLAMLGHRLASLVVSEGRRHYACTIAEEVGSPRVLVEMVRAWAAAKDAHVTAASIAWGRLGCELCGLAALASGDAASTCEACAPRPVTP